MSTPNDNHKIDHDHEAINYKLNVAQSGNIKWSAYHRHEPACAKPLGGHRSSGTTAGTHWPVDRPLVLERRKKKLKKNKITVVPSKNYREALTKGKEPTIDDHRYKLLRVFNPHSSSIPVRLPLHPNL